MVQMTKNLVHSFYCILYQPKGLPTPSHNFSQFRVDSHCAIATQNSIQFHLRSNVQSVSNVFGIPFLLFHIFLNAEVVQH